MFVYVYGVESEPNAFRLQNTETGSEKMVESH